MTVLSELTGNEKMAALFRERQIALGHALPLGSYLLKPVQRILKYHLLLQVNILLPILLIFINLLFNFPSSEIIQTM